MRRWAFARWAVPAAPKHQLDFELRALARSCSRREGGGAIGVCLLGLVPRRQKRAQVPHCGSGARNS
eukprot:9902233-Alexandrium_andersonii.AAC.1